MEDQIKFQNEIIRLKEEIFSLRELLDLKEIAPDIFKSKVIRNELIKECERFIKSKAFKVDNAEQAYVLIKAGEEMGLKPIEALQTLYIINGNIAPYGDGMVAILTKNGYKLSYINETNSQVTVKVTNGESEYEYTAKDSDQTISKGNAIKFAKQQKLRFHAVRMIITFHLPHLFGACTDMFTIDYQDTKKLNSNNIEKDLNIVINNLNSCNDGEKIALYESLPSNLQQEPRILELINKK